MKIFKIKFAMNKYVTVLADKEGKILKTLDTMAGGDAQVKSGQYVDEEIVSSTEAGEGNSSVVWQGECTLSNDLTYEEFKDQEPEYFL